MNTKIIKCAEGCNKPEYLLINGEEQTYYCSVSAEKNIFDMILSTDTISFHVSDKVNGIVTIEVF